MAPSRTEPGPLERLAELFSSRGGRWLTRLGVVALSLLATGLLLREARGYAYGLRGYRLGPSSVRFIDLPPGAGRLVAQSLCNPRWLRLDVSVFDSRAEERIRDAVARHPMVAGVESIEIRFPCTVDVRVQLRQPAGWFQVRGPGARRGWLLVSTDAHVLEPKLYEHYLSRLRVPLPRVVGVRAQPPRFVRQAWEDRDEQVVEALAAVQVAGELYRDFNGRLVVEEIDVGAFPATPQARRLGEVRLVLHDGTRIEWGRTDRAVQGVAGEDAYVTKRARLEELLARQAAPRAARLDVRYRLAGEGSGVASPR